MMINAKIISREEYERLIAKPAKEKKESKSKPKYKYSPITIVVRYGNTEEFFDSEVRAFIRRNMLWTNGIVSSIVKVKTRKGILYEEVLDNKQCRPFVDNIKSVSSNQMATDFLRKKRIAAYKAYLKRMEVPDAEIEILIGNE